MPVEPSEDHVEEDLDEVEDDRDEVEDLGDLDLDADLDEDDDDRDDAAEADNASVRLSRVEHTVDAAGGYVYDLADWPRDIRQELDAMIVDVGVERVWQGPELVVRSMDGPDVVDAMDELILAHGVTGGIAGERVLYEIGNWPSGFKASVVESLNVAGIKFEWDQSGNLVVAARDEATVDGIFESMPDPDEVAEDADGLEVQDLLTELYAAVDVLYKNPDSPSSRLSLANVADRIEWVPVPFGFEASDWDRLVADAVSLRASVDADAVAGENADEAEFVTRCTALRTRLRSLV